MTALRAAYFVFVELNACLGAPQMGLDAGAALQSFTAASLSICIVLLSQVDSCHIQAHRRSILINFQLIAAAHSAYHDHNGLCSSVMVQRCFVLLGSIHLIALPALCELHHHVTSQFHKPVMTNI